MENIDVKDKFVELRAKGNSLKKISDELGVTKQTLLNWGKSLNSEIKNQRAFEYDALIEKYKLTRENKIKVYVEFLDKINQELSSRDLSGTSTDKLFLLMLKIRQELDKEQTGVSFVTDEWCLDSPKTYWTF